MLKIYLLILISLLSASCGANGEPEFKRVCIYPNWAALRSSQQAKLLPRNIDPHLCTHIHFAYANIDVRTLKLIPSLSEDTASGRHGEPLYKQIMQLKKANPDLKVLISIGGWLVKSTPFNRILIDKKALRTFINHVITFMDKWNFDGLDIQWEYPGAIEFGATTDSKTRYMLLIKHLRAAFKSKYLLTTFVPADESHIDNGYQVDFICVYLDYVSVETYDFSNHFKTVHNSPLYSRSNETSVERSMSYWTKRGCPKNKLLVGLPTYSRGLLIDKSKSREPLGLKGKVYIEPSEYTDETGILSYYEVCKMTTKSGSSKYWDNKAKIAYLVADHDKQSNLWISHENRQSAKDKAEFVKKSLLGGISIWSIDLDDFDGKFCSEGKYPIAQAIKKVLHVQPKNTSTVTKKTMERKNDFLTTKITKYIYVAEPPVDAISHRGIITTRKPLENLRVDFTYRFSTRRPAEADELEDKPLSYFQSLYKKYKSLRAFQVVTCFDENNCNYNMYLNSGSNRLGIGSNSRTLLATFLILNRIF